MGLDPEETASLGSDRALERLDSSPAAPVPSLGPVRSWMSRFANVGAAVIGTGFIGTVHVEQLRRIGVDVRGVLGSTPERSAARADALDVRHGYATLDEILNDDSVDVVHVTSPNHLHVPQASAILAAGKHVVCEKPLAMTAAESARLLGQAARRGARKPADIKHPVFPP